MLPRFLLVGVLPNVWATILIGCGETATPGQIPRVREKTGILYLNVSVCREGRVTARTVGIDGGTYTCRYRHGTGEGEKAEFGPHSRVPERQTNVIWRLADEIVRRSPGLRADAPPDPRPSTNVMEICVEGAAHWGEYYVLWPPGTAPPDPNVRRLVNLLREVDRADTQASFSPFRN